MPTIKRFSGHWLALLLITACTPLMASVDTPVEPNPYTRKVLFVLKDELPAQPASGSGLFESLTSIRPGLSRPVDVPAPALSQGSSPQATEMRAAADRLNRLYVGQIAAGRTMVQALEELRASGLVEYAEPDYHVVPLANPEGINDPYFAQVYGMDNEGQQFWGYGGYVSGTADADIDWPEAWESGHFPKDNGVIVAVIDTGVDYLHEDLAANMWVNEAERNGLPGVDDDNNGYVDDIYGIDALNGDSNPMDDHMHGTHCAGTIAAVANNGAGFSGVNPYARIMALKFLGPNGGSTSGAITCIEYAIANGAQVMSNSWGGGAYSQALQDAITLATSNGIVFVAAAGNSNTGSAAYPAAYSGVLCVTASDSHDERAWFTNYGKHCDIMAPGVGIFSARASVLSPDDLSVFDQNSNYASISGTSMACPAVAGAVSLLIAKYPGKDPFLYEGALKYSSDPIYAIPDRNGDGETNDQFNGLLGKGRLNVNQALVYSNPADRPFFDVAVTGADGISSVGFALPGDTFNVSLTIGAWDTAVNNLTVEISESSADLRILSTSSLALDDLAPGDITSLPSGTFQLELSADAEWGGTHAFTVTLKQGSKTIDTYTYNLQVYDQRTLEFATGDLDGDGTKEVIGYVNEIAFVFTPSGQLKWYGVGNKIGLYWGFDDILVGEFDGNPDNGKEVAMLGGDVLTSGRSFTIFHADGTFYKEFGYDATAFGFTAHSWDTNDDGVDEIIMKTDGFPIFWEDENWEDVAEMLLIFDTVQSEHHEENGSVLILNESFLTNIEEQVNTYSLSEPLKGDCNGDGTDEMVIMLSPAYNKLKDDPSLELDLFILPLDGDPSDPSAKRISLGHYNLKSDPVLGDFDGNGSLDLLCVVQDEHATWTTLMIDLVDHKLHGGYPQYLNTRNGTFSVADLDRDGDLELISRTETPFNRIVAYHHDGTVVEGFPFDDLDSVRLEAQDLAVGDINADGYPEIVYLREGVDDEETLRQTFSVMAINRRGEIVHGYPMEFEQALGNTAGGVFNAVTIETLFPAFTEGEQPNVTLVAQYGSGFNVIDTGYQFNPQVNDWPIASHDYQKTNTYNYTPSALEGRFTVMDKVGYNTLDTQFYAQAYGPDLDGVAFEWDFDYDGSTFTVDTTGQAPTHNYATPGAYTVALRTTNTAGETFLFVRQNVVNVYGDAVDAAFTTHPGLPYSGAGPIRIEFTDTSLNGANSWVWEYSTDGGSNWTAFGTDKTASFLFEQVGTFDVRLSASSSIPGGASDTHTVSSAVTITSVEPTPTHYVSKMGTAVFPYTTWETAANTIQDALEAAGEGDTVIVGPGTYTHRNSWEMNVARILSENITLRSSLGYQHTILDAQNNGRVLLSKYSGTIVEGFTITNGRAFDASGVLIDSGAMNCEIRNCLVTKNNSYFLFGNIAKGAIYGECDTLVENCEVSFNTTSGIAAAIGFRWADLGEDFTAVVQSSQIHHNASSYEEEDYGGIITYGHLKNCHIYLNEAVNGLLLGVDAFRPWNHATVDNCTIVDNISKTGAVRASLVRNSIVYGNKNPTGTKKNWHSDMDPSSPFVTMSYINSDSPKGDNQISGDPAFVDAANGDYRLSSGSPCIDAGYNWLLPSGYTEEFRVQIDFGDATTIPNWNAITLEDSLNTDWHALIRSTDGLDSGINFRFGTDWSSTSSKGTATGVPEHGDFSGETPDFISNYYPVEACTDTLWVSGSSEGRQFHFQGLDPNKRYDLRVYASLDPNVQLYTGLSGGVYADSDNKYTIYYADTIDEDDLFNSNYQLPSGEKAYFAVSQKYYAGVAEQMPIEFSNIELSNGDLGIRMWSGSHDYPFAFSFIELVQFSIEYNDPSPLVTMTDAVGQPRVYNNSVDLGGLEYQGANPPLADIAVSANELRAGKSVTFDASGSTGADTYAWDFDNDGEFDDGSGIIAAYTWADADYYTVRLRASDSSSGLYGEASFIVYVTPKTPLAASDLAVTSGTSTQVTLTWTDNTSDVGYDETGYRIERTDNTFVPFEQIIDDADPQVVFDDDNYAKVIFHTAENASAYNGSYTYTDWQLDDNNSIIYPSASATVKLQLPVEGNYEIFVRYPDHTDFPIYLWTPFGDLQTQWSRNATYYIHTTDGNFNVGVNQRFNGGEWVSLGEFELPIHSYVQYSILYTKDMGAIDAFKIVRRADWVTVGTVGTVGANVTTFSETVEDDATYTYRVVAINDNGESPASNEISVSVPNQNALPTIDSIDWDLPIDTIAPTALAPQVTASDADGSIVSYAWDFGDNHEGAHKEGTNLTNPTYSFRYPGTYTMVCTVTDDNGDSVSTTQEITIANTEPPAPVTDLQTVISDGNVALSWTNPTDIDFTGVLILRREGAAIGDSPSDYSSYTLGQSLGTSTVVYFDAGTSYNDSTVVNGTTYHYKVFAYDATNLYAEGVATSATPDNVPVTLGKYQFTDDSGNDESGELKTPNDEGNAHTDLTFSRVSLTTDGSAEIYQNDPRGYDNLSIRKWSNATSLNENEYFSITVQTKPERLLLVDRLECLIRQEDNSYSAQNFAVRAYRDAELMDEISFSFSNETWQSQTIDFIDFTADENQTVEFRFYCWNGNPTKNKSDVLWDDIDLFGFVQQATPPDPYGDWLAGNNLSGNDALAEADPDGDGIVNLLEYAFNLDPLGQSVGTGSSFSAPDPQSLGFIFRLNAHASNIYLSIDYASQLPDWQVGYSTDPTESPDGFITLDPDFHDTAPDGTPLHQAVLQWLDNDQYVLRVRVTKPE